MRLSPIVDHGYLLGLGDDDHPQYLHLNKAAQTLLQNLAVSAGVTIDGVDISAHAANASAHHAKYLDSDAVAAISAGNLTKLVVETNTLWADGGQVGFGTSSPSAQAHIKAPLKLLQFEESDGTVNKRRYYWAAIDDRIRLIALNDADTWVRNLITFQHDGDVAIHSGNLAMGATKTVDGVDISNPVWLTTITHQGAILKSGIQTEGRCHAGLSPFVALAGNQVTVCFREKLTNTPSSVTLSNVATTDENNMAAGYPQALRVSLFSFGFFIRAAALGDANSCDKKFLTVGN